MKYDVIVKHHARPLAAREAGGASWPAARSEEATWQPNPAGRYTHRERQIQTGPYLRAVLPHIVGAQPWITGEAAAHVDEASAEIVRFDAEMGAEIAPFGAILLRTESAASSKIEQLSASARAIATAEVDEGAATRNAAEIVANTRAMQAVIGLASGQLDAEAILTAHRVLLASWPEVAGQWRRQQVWIGPGEAGPRVADYVPPHHDSVPGLVADLTAFIERTDIPVLIQAALAHAQFENIHPFADGNGRTGRALIHALLRNKGLTVQATVPVSAGLLADTAAYFNALRVYRDGDIEPIVSLLATASVRAVAGGRSLVEDLRAVREQWNTTVRVRRGAAAWRLADLLLRQPVITTETVTRELGVAASNVPRILKPLEAAGVLVSSAGSRRNSRIWRAPEILERLDKFADMADRRILG